MAASESEEPGLPNPRKRQKTAGKSQAGKDSEEAKRARGRPRVEAQDETAADRRRTQIRLAQRAYRQRKETTIMSLKKRVGDLQNTIEEMNKAFLQFNDRAMSSGLLGVQPDLARELRTTTEQFLQLARSAAAGNTSDGEDADEDHGKPEARKRRDATQMDVEGEVQRSRLSHSPNRTIRDIGWGYTQRLDDGTSSGSEQQSNDRSNEFLPGVPRHEANFLMQRFRDPTSTQYLHFLGLEDPTTTSDAMEMTSTRTADITASVFEQFHALVPSPPAVTESILDPSAPLTLVDSPFNRPNPEPKLPDLFANSKLSMPWTYSFQENSFARRLHRASIERAFHLISQADFRPQRFGEVFRLTLMYSSREQIRSRLRQLLSRGMSEELDNTGGPFVHLGGAGTHYPRRDAQGNLIPRPEPGTWTQERMGPLKKPRPPPSPLGMDVAGVEEEKEHEVWEIIKGFEGEWFDPYDVAGYLEERGLQFPQDGLSSFVEGEITEDETLLDAEHPSTNHNSPRPSSNAIDMSMSTQGVSAIEKSPTLPMDKQLEHSMAPFPGTFHDLASVENAQAAFNSNVFGFEMNKMDDFTASSWLQNSGMTVTTTGTSPSMLTTATTITSSPDAVMDPSSQVQRKGKKFVTVDVSKMIDELINRCVCLGRTPGFRRKDVNTALNLSIVPGLFF